MVVSYTYDAWGKVLSVTGSLANTVGAINPMRYRGYYLDSETGYYYLQSRYYNPEFCRFINADEPSYIGVNKDVFGYNLYLYGNNNPVNNIDATGHWTSFWYAFNILRWTVAYNNYKYNSRIDINSGYINGQALGLVSMFKFGAFRMSYTYQFFHVKHLLESGRLGKIQFLRGSHYQDMSNWPSYWMGLPPMYYGTHAIAPMVALSGSRIKKVHCFGFGTMEDWLTKQYNNPYPIESAIFEFENGLKGEATRSLFETARVYQDGMFVYGSNMSFEWGFGDSDNPYITTLASKETDA